MRQVILFLAACCAMPTLYAQQKTLQVTEAVKMEHLPMEYLTGSDRYDDNVYIFNPNYVVYQDYDHRKVFTPDRATFNVIEDHFSADKNGIYYQGELVKVDTTGFKILGSKEIRERKDYVIGIERYYWRTNKQVFFGTKPITVSDPATFEQLTYCYYKDKNCVYYYDQPLEEVDPNKINERFTTESRLNDGKYVYYEGKPLYYKGERVEQLSSYVFKTSKYILGYIIKDDRTGSIVSELHSEDFDVPTFKALTSTYFVDKNHLYYFPPSYPVYDDGFRLPISTENLSKVRAYHRTVTDGEVVYQEKKPIERDAATFAEFPTEDYYQYDKNGVYNWNEKLPFRYTNPPVYGKNLFYIENAILYENQLYYHYPDPGVVVLTPQQVTQLKTGKISYEQFFPDNDPEYIPAPDPDPAIFTRISYYFYKDKNKVYYFDRWAKGKEIFREVKGYDVATLKEITNDLLADKDYVYAGRYRLVKNKDLEVLAIYAGYRKGCSQDTTPATNFYLLKNAEGYWMIGIEFGEKGEAYRHFLGKKLKGFKI